uniref:Nodal modulator n=1 Tax=Eptatretus burgeri TaxID=7764 RepID=A0A8C4QP48_EPTBU
KIGIKKKKCSVVLPLYFLCLCFFFSLSSLLAATDELLGCGGFVKSDVELDFSLIEVREEFVMFFGVLRTAVSPSGHVWVICWIQGDFILTIEPPQGWSFEPSRVELQVDGHSDRCSRGEDIDFTFQGFAITGQVRRSLYWINTSVIFPDHLLKKNLYKIVASHPKWSLSPRNLALVVKAENVHLGSALAVVAYDVQGSVRGEEEPVQGVQFLLFSQSVEPLDVSGCSMDPVAGFSAPSDLPQFICSATSDSKGHFFFSLPPGKYELVPFYMGERITFDVAPSRLSFSVQHDSVILKPDFLVMGFSVTGRVLETTDGNGIAGAMVTINDRIKVVTQADGSFRVENMTAGAYTITTTKDHYTFSHLSAIISPGAPNLADIVAVSFSVCGGIFVKRFPEGLRPNQARVVSIEARGPARQIQTTESDPQGSFCFMVEPGQFLLKVLLSEAETQAGLALQPQQIKLVVTDHPVLGLKFDQALASVSGKVFCLASCKGLTISLQRVLLPGERRNMQLVDPGSHATFSFSGLLLGHYRVSVVQDEWCWKNRSLVLELGIAGSPMMLEFRQTGFLLKCSVSHDVSLEFYQEEADPPNVGVYNLTKGLNRFCLSLPGVYKLSPRSCHRFEQETYTYNTAGELVTVAPSSAELLFSPEYVEAEIHGDWCPQDLQVLRGEAGLFLKGHVHPALQGVQIVIQEQDLNHTLLTLHTDPSGAYRVGPLPAQREYLVSASKEGFLLQAEEDSPGNFKAFALSTVSLKIFTDDGQPLPGVLLSLSGGQFRSNRLTLDDGSLKFTDLTPGQYFVKPMMKEYRFDPTAQMVEVLEGLMMHIDIVGHRIAFSCYGEVTSLNGEPEPGVLVCAVGLGECVSHTEETSTSGKGQFRLRGLLPSCMYNVSIKAEGNDHIERAIPLHTDIQVGQADVSGVKIITFRRTNEFDLSGNVICPPEYLPTLKAVLYRGEDGDSPFQTVSFGHSSFFHFPPLQHDGEVYVLTLDSSLSQVFYDYELPAVSFSTSGLHKHITFNFSPVTTLNGLYGVKQI